MADGCRNPLVAWGNILIDGHNRYEICTRLGLPFKVVNKEFASKAHARVWIRSNQAGQRNLPDAWAPLVLDGPIIANYPHDQDTVLLWRR